MISNEFIKKIEGALKNELPGMESHLKMTPYRSLVKEIPENKREGAVLVMLYKKEGELYFPLTQRYEYEGAHSNQISFPGGKVERFDENLYHTALRETEEEIGVFKEKINRLGELSQVYIPPSNFLVSAFLSYHPELPIFIKEEKEVKEILEVPLRLILDSNSVKSTKVDISNGLKLTTPYFDFEGKVIWGATAAILSEIKDIFNSIELEWSQK